MESSQTPLLERQSSSHTSSDASEDLERGLDSGAGHDFRQLIHSQPEAVIKCALTCIRSKLAVCFLLVLLPLPDLAMLNVCHCGVRLGYIKGMHLCPCLIVSAVDVCRFLEKKGMKQLGSFSVPVSCLQL